MIFDPNVAPWRQNAVIGSFLAISVISVGVTVGSVYFTFRYAIEQNDYRSATRCPAPSSALSGDSCRYSGSATVVAVRPGDPLSIDVVFAGLPNRAFAVKFWKGRDPASALVAQGATATADLWDGRVTRFAEIDTTDSPEDLPKNVWILALFFGPSFVLTLRWGLQGLRQSRALRQGRGSS